MAETLSPAQKFTVLRQTTEKYPLKCKLFINLLLSNLPQGQQIQTPKDFKRAYSSFSHVFTKQTVEEKLSFVGQITDHINACLRNEKNGTTNIIHQIQTSCEIKTSMMGISYWDKRTFKYDYQTHRIKLSSSKKQDIIDLRVYLARQSSSEKHAMVLEAVQKGVSDKMSKVIIKFKNSSIFQEIYGTVRRGIFDLLQQKIQQLINEDMKQLKNEKPIESSRTNKGFTILTTKNMTEYFNTKEKLTQKLRKNRKNAFMICNKNNTRIYRSQVNKKCFYVEQSIMQNMKIQEIKANIAILAQQSIKDKIVAQILQNFNQNISANYYKLDVTTKEYQLLVINEKNQKEGVVQHTMKAATDFFLDISVQFVIASLEKVNEQEYQFKMSLILNTHSKKSSKITKDIIDLLMVMAYPNAVQNVRKGSFSKKISLSGKENNSVVDLEVGKLKVQNPNQSVNFNIVNELEQNYTTSSGKKSNSDSQNMEEAEIEEIDEDNEIFYSIIDDDEDDLKVYSSLDEKMVSLPGSVKKISIKNIAQDIEPTQSTVAQDSNFLTIKAFNEPLPPSDLKILSEHFLFGEWRRSSKGGVVCADEEVVKEQKRILKLVFSRIGSNIFKGNSCMNVSLPIQLFRKESFLACIAKNLTYAPILLEPSIAYDPVERMKNVLIFSIGLNCLALSTRKPFNPILGQTYQGEIAGCPIFMEQISHHPPITSIYFVGRGYKIYGTMQIDVNLRLNYVRGVNHCNITIEYDSGDKITFDLPVLVLNGLILGERTIYYDSTVHFIDHKNMLIGQLTYDARNSKKSMFSFKNQSPDYLSGEIYKVSPAFLEKFIESNQKLSRKKDEKSEVLAKVYGQWNGKIFFDDKLTFDFEEQLPVELENVPFPIPSDSFLRSDVLEMIKEDLDTAQDQKDRLEEIQRKDKKLRLAFNKAESKKK